MVTVSVPGSLISEARMVTDAALRLPLFSGTEALYQLYSVASTAVAAAPLPGVAGWFSVPPLAPAVSVPLASRRRSSAIVCT